MGRNQHYLPQFLLRRFSSRRARDKFFIWLFRRGEDPSQPNVRNVGAASYFYSKEESGAESILGKLEDRYAGFLRDLDAAAAVPVGRDSECVDFAAHLLVRTNNLRESTVEAFEATAKQAINKAKNSPELESRLLARFIPQLSAAGMKREEIVALVRRGIYEKLPEMIDAIGGEDGILRRINIPSSAQAVQARVIQTGFMGRKATLESLAWHLVQSDDDSLVLGDVGAIAQSRRETPLEPGMTFTIETHRRLIIPISPNSLLVGVLRGELGTPLPEAVEINQASAELSRTFFVSNRNEESERRLHSCVGLRGTHLLDRVRSEIGSS